MDRSTYAVIVFIILGFMFGAMGMERQSTFFFGAGFGLSILMLFEPSRRRP